MTQSTMSDDFLSTSLNIEEDYFSKRDFNPDQYVSLITNGNITVGKLKDQHDQIVALSDKTAQDLKTNVFKNYKRFIEASKEICKLDSEMRNIDAALNEDQDIFESINTLVTTGSADGLEQKADQQSRLQQVQGLDWSDPLVAGECVHQARFTCFEPELSNKVNTHAHGFLLTNSFVFATYTQYGRSGRKSTKEHLNLDSVEPLSVVKVKDLRDTKDCKNAFEIEGTSLMRILVCASAREKKIWLAVFRRTACVEVDGGQTTTSDDDDGGNDEWLQNVPEDLDVYIAQRDFENSVCIAAKAQKALSAQHSSTGNRALVVVIEEKIGVLIDTLCLELKRPAMRLTSTRSTVQYLLQLGETDRAHQMYLENRSENIKTNIRNLKMEGSTELYVMKLSHSFFSTLRSTCIEFNDLFDNTTKSAFVVWVTRELERFATSFKQQVLQSITKFPTIAKCVPEMMRQCKLLNNHGLDLEFVLWRLIEVRTIEAIKDAGRELRGSISSDLVDEIWEPQPLNGNHHRKQFVKKMHAVEFLQIEQYNEEKRCVLFVATTTLICKMVEWINCLELLADFEMLVDTMLQHIVDTLEMFLKSGIIKNKNPTQQEIFEKNMTALLWITDNALSKMKTDDNATSTLLSLRSDLALATRRCVIHVICACDIMSYM
eukprot:m.147012 g.147012  ORF g.147012 m.147012 type:complete len:659 (+) comp30512_c0_seq5:223-2199(+)